MGGRSGGAQSGFEDEARQEHHQPGTMDDPAQLSHGLRRRLARDAAEAVVVDQLGDRRLLAADGTLRVLAQPKDV